VCRQIFFSLTFPFLLTFPYFCLLQKYELLDVVFQIFGVKGAPQNFLNAKCAANQDRLRTTALRQNSKSVTGVNRFVS
jgi:hypothetical protein